MENLVGKKILVIHTKRKRKVFTGVVVGHDPEIGICIAKPGEEHNPWLVYDGPLSPNFKYCIWSKEDALTINTACLDQIKSGYISIFAIKKLISDLGAEPTYYGSTSCPYSL